MNLSISSFCHNNLFHLHIRSCRQNHWITLSSSSCRYYHWFKISHSFRHNDWVNLIICLQYPWYRHQVLRHRRRCHLLLLTALTSLALCARACNTRRNRMLITCAKLQKLAVTFLTIAFFAATSRSIETLLQCGAI